MPTWGPDLSELNMDEIVTYVKPDAKMTGNWKDVPEDIKDTFDRLGIPEAEKKSLAGVGAQYDSEVVYHSIQESLVKQGVVYTDMLYPCSILHGENARCEFTGVTFASKGQHLDTGASVIHAAPHTSANISTRTISKAGGIAAYRSAVKVTPDAHHDYGVEFTYAEEKFQAVMTDDRTAKFLNVKKSLPSLKIERFTYERDLVIEYTVSMPGKKASRYRQVESDDIDRFKGRRDFCGGRHRDRTAAAGGGRMLCRLPA